MCRVVYALIYKLIDLGWGAKCFLCSGYDCGGKKDVADRKFFEYTCDSSRLVKYVNAISSKKTRLRFAEMIIGIPKLLMLDI